LRDRLARHLRRFARDESGAVTVEAVLWLPFFMALLILIADVSFAFYAKAQAYRVIESANRAYAVALPEARNLTRTREWIRQRLSPISPRATVTTSVSGGLVSSVVVMPSSDILFMDFGNFFSAFNLTVRAQQYVE
jgi:Flp pilus assembly protein TadG